MPGNVEVRAKARDPRRQRALAAALTAPPPEVLAQRDTFFHTPAAAGRRLKLREVRPAHGEFRDPPRAEAAPVRTRGRRTLRRPS